LWLRSAVRVVVSLAEGAAGSREALYSLASSVQWESLVAPGQTIVVDVAGQGSGFGNTGFAALTVKDAAVDRIRARRGVRPDVARDGADVRIHLHLAGEQASIGLDSSGEPLAHRGYRPRGGPAPLAETTAAGILLSAGYDGSQPLIDPMAGTGTIAIEGASIATRTAPGSRRRFAMERWAFFDSRIAVQLRTAARTIVRTPPAPILARDADARAVVAARRNATEAGLAAAIEVVHGDVRDLAPLGPGWLLVSNPPYGKRLGDGDELAGLYRAVGDAIKRCLGGGTAWLLVGNPELAKAIGLRASRRVVVFNGPIECRLVRFDAFVGSWKERSEAEKPRDPS
jgi:putative N6-adenine-specific DNA methylase